MKADSFETFFKSNYSKAYYLALRHLHDEETSRDLVADAFEQVWTKARVADKDYENIKSYLMTTVRNRCISYLRKQQTANKYAKIEQYTMELTYEDDYDYNEREQRMVEVMETLNELTPKTRQIIKACYVERKKYREVAAEYDISESAVKKHVMHALSFLRQKFKNKDG
ncbi:MAG: sigma-70 family RNA polymerase sigma factor [Prevotella sp.]|nr:sigma-70 family RNA polymerase sigma factor [Prevotella sp.]MDY4038366.1 sigma-70 family RNA polymerase sigma factor [Prevotella sp.]